MGFSLLGLGIQMDTVNTIFGVHSISTTGPGPSYVGKAGADRYGPMIQQGLSHPSPTTPTTFIGGFTWNGLAFTPSQNAH